MKIHLGGDHAAYDLQRHLVQWLTDAGHEVVDHGPAEYDAVDDYPVFVLPAARAVAEDPASLGIVLGGSGNGEQIAANKVAGVRAARAAGLDPVKINAVLIRGENDHEATSLLRFALEHGYHLRFIEQMPLDAQHAWDSESMVSADEVHALLAERFPEIAHERSWAFAGSGIASAVSGLSQPALEVGYRFFYWTQMIVVLSFLVTLLLRRRTIRRQ